MRNCARAMSSIHFSTCNILSLKETLIFTFSSPFCIMNFSAIFPMYLGTAKATSKKNQVQRCFHFPLILLSQDTYNDTHYEIIGVDKGLERGEH